MSSNTNADNAGASERERNTSSSSDSQATIVQDEMTIQGEDGFVFDPELNGSPLSDGQISRLINGVEEDSGPAEQTSPLEGASVNRPNNLQHIAAQGLGAVFGQLSEEIGSEHTNPPQTFDDFSQEYDLPYPQHAQGNDQNTAVESPSSSHQRGSSATVTYPSPSTAQQSVGPYSSEPPSRERSDFYQSQGEGRAPSELSYPYASSSEVSQQTHDWNYGNHGADHDSSSLFQQGYSYNDFFGDAMIDNGDDFEFEVAEPGSQEEAELRQSIRNGTAVFQTQSLPQPAMPSAKDLMRMGMQAWKTQTLQAQPGSLKRKALPERDVFEEALEPQPAPKRLQKELRAELQEEQAAPEAADHTPKQARGRKRKANAEEAAASEPSSHAKAQKKGQDLKGRVSGTPKVHDRFNRRELDMFPSDDDEEDDGQTIRETNTILDSWPKKHEFHVYRAFNNSRLKYPNLKAATDVYYNRPAPDYVPHEDATVPKTATDQCAYMIMLMDAAFCMDEAEDNDNITVQWERACQEQRNDIELGLWAMLEKIIEYHQRPGFLGKRDKNTKAKKIATFARHIQLICGAFRRQKTQCRHLLQEWNIMSIVDDPHSQERRVRNNRKVNGAKKSVAQMNASRAAALEVAAQSEMISQEHLKNLLTHPPPPVEKKKKSEHATEAEDGTKSKQCRKKTRTKRGTKTLINSSDLVKQDETTLEDEGLEAVAEEA